MVPRPDANQLRSRKQSQEKDDVATQERLCTLKGLKPTEVAIDGVIYDLTNFDHPGGASLQIFGGNDVTVTYRMIHPYHTSKHLEKMSRVGKVADYVCE